MTRKLSVIASEKTRHLCHYGAELRIQLMPPMMPRSAWLNKASNFTVQWTCGRKRYSLSMDPVSRELCRSVRETSPQSPAYSTFRALVSGKYVPKRKIFYVH